MKRITKLLSVLLLGLGIFALSSCEAMNEVMKSTYDTWYLKTIELNSKSSSTPIAFDCYLIYSEEGLSSSKIRKDSLFDNQGKLVSSIQPGLTAILIPAAGSNETLVAEILSEATSSCYFVKNWANDDEFNSDTSTGFKMGASMWTTIALFGNLEEDAMPECIKNTAKGSQYTLLSKDALSKENLTNLITQILVQAAVDKLMEGKE